MPSGAFLPCATGLTPTAASCAASPREGVGFDVRFSRALPERRTCPALSKSPEVTNAGQVLEVNAGRYSSRNICQAHRNPSRRASSLTRAMLPPPPVPPKLDDAGVASSDAGSASSDLRKGIIRLSEASSPGSKRNAKTRASLCTVQG